MGKLLTVKFSAGNSWSLRTGKLQKEEAGRGWRWRRARLGGMRLGREQQWDRRVAWSASCPASSPLRPCSKAESRQQDWVISFAVPRASHQPECVPAPPNCHLNGLSLLQGCWGEGRPAWDTPLVFSHCCPCCGSERGPHPCLVHHTQHSHPPMPRRDREMVYTCGRGSACVEELKDGEGFRVGSPV